MKPDDVQRRALSEQMARFGDVLAGFAHEVRNPLSTIGLNLQLIREDFVDAESARDRRTHKRLSVVEAEVRRLQEILEEFLRYARLPGVQTAPTDLNALLRAVVEFTAPELAERGVSLRLYPGADVGLPPLDQNQIRAALVNLLRNAAEACGPGSEVILSSRRDGHRVLIHVIDTGAGMTPEVLDRIFKPYFSTKKAGTGLGLPMVKRIVEQHGGFVAANSEPGRGTQFTLHLPAPLPAALPQPEGDDE